MKKLNRAFIALIILVCALSCAEQAAAEYGWMCPTCKKVNAAKDTFCTNCRSSCTSSVFDAMLADGIGYYSGFFLPDGAELRQGRMDSKGETESFRFIPQNDGKYGLYLTEADSGFSVNFSVYDENHYLIGKVKKGCGRGEGYCVDLNAGKVYTICIEQNRGTGNYTATLFKANPVRTIDGLTHISDSFTYAGQENTYLYRAPATGVYRFGIYECMNGFKADIGVFTQTHYSSGNVKGCKQGEGKNVTLEEGEIYVFRVSQNTSIGNYTFFIMPARKTQDISGYQAAGDEIFFDGENILYTYKAPASGSYIFTVQFLKEGQKINISILDETNHSIGHGKGLHRNDSVKCNLEAGRTYTICIEQNTETGCFTVGISR